MSAAGYYATLTPESREQVRRQKRLQVENAGGTSTGRENRPWVPAAVIVALIEPLAEEFGWSWVALRAGVSERRLYDIRRLQGRVGFDLADRIVCFVLGAPQLWHEIPELREAYES